ncbi:MAG: uroporphyrinogen-III synthase [Limimaricola soesokkakensis]|uniref:uroporphyrinogen-III synthase n=1 Tax=Limimaricola soesokkakensis TaxID=1343159 RepID=UPI0040593744
MPEPTLLLTRPEPAARRFLAELEIRAGRHLKAVIAPLMRIDEMTPPRPARSPAALILTSERGAWGAARMGYTGLPAWCVGPRTAQAARLAGLDPRPGGGTAETLIAAILKAPDEGPLLHLRGDHQRGDLADRLRAAGRGCDEAVVYAQTARPLSEAGRHLLSGRTPVVAPVFSPRSAALLAACAPIAAPLALVAISAAAARPLSKLGPPVTMASRPDADAMIDATLEAHATFGCRDPMRGGGA